MNKIIFTKEQINNLLENPNVLRCSSKSITYSKEFKINAIKQYEQGLGPQEIFMRAGFDLNAIGKKKPNDCLLRWNRAFKEKGLKALSEVRGKNSRGRPFSSKIAGVGSNPAIASILPHVLALGSRTRSLCS